MSLVSVYETQHSISFTCSVFALLEKFEARRNRNAEVIDALYAFEFSAIHLVIKFLVPCRYLLIKCGIC